MFNTMDFAEEAVDDAVDATKVQGDSADPDVFSPFKETFAGAMRGIEILGADAPGGMASMAVNLAAEAANKGLDYYGQKSAADAQGKDDDAKLAAVKSADEAATKANAAAMYAQAQADKSKKTSDAAKAGAAKAGAAKIVAEQVARMQDSAGANLSPAVTAKRVEAANQASLAAAKVSLADPSNVMNSLLAEAARQTAMKAAGAQMASLPPDPAAQAAALEAMRAATEDHTVRNVALGVGGALVAGLGAYFAFFRKRK